MMMTMFVFIFYLLGFLVFWIWALENELAD